MIYCFSSHLFPFNKIVCGIFFTFDSKSKELALHRLFLQLLNSKYSPRTIVFLCLNNPIYCILQLGYYQNPAQAIIACDVE